MDIRKAIKKVLEKEFTVHNIGVLDKNATLDLPFVILEMNGLRRAMRSAYLTFSVFMYVPIKLPIKLDECEKKVMRLLHKKRIEGKEGAFYVENMGSGADFINEKINALGKVIEFRVPTIY